MVVSIKNQVVTQWNSVFQQFINELAKKYPDTGGVKNMNIKFNIGKTVSLNYPINMFTENVKEHKTEIRNKNSHYFVNEDIPFIKDLELDKIYEQTDEETKMTIWNYLIALLDISEVYDKLK